MQLPITNLCFILDQNVAKLRGLKCCEIKNLEKHWGKKEIVKRNKRNNSTTFRSAILHFNGQKAVKKALAMDKTLFRGDFLVVKASTADMEISEADEEEEEKKKQQQGQDSIVEFVMQLNRRFVPEICDLRRCPYCFFPVVKTDLIRGSNVYYCPKCYRACQLVHNVDERMVYQQCGLCFTLAMPNEMIPCHRKEHLFCSKCIDRWTNYCSNIDKFGVTKKWHRLLIIP